MDQALASYGVTCSSTGATCQIQMQPNGSSPCLVVTVTYPYETRPLPQDVPLVSMPVSLMSFVVPTAEASSITVAGLDIGLGNAPLITDAIVA